MCERVVSNITNSGTNERNISFPHQCVERFTVVEHTSPTRHGRSPESREPVRERFHTVPCPSKRQHWYVKGLETGRRREGRSTKGMGPRRDVSCRRGEKMAHGPSGVHEDRSGAVVSRERAATTWSFWVSTPARVAAPRRSGLGSSVGRAHHGPQRIWFLLVRRRGCTTCGPG